MQNQNTPDRDQQTLEAIAEPLLWAGFDRAADEIYAAIGLMTQPIATAQQKHGARYMEARRPKLAK